MKSKFTWIFTLLLAFFIQFSFAQERTVTGVVNDSQGMPIPGVNVKVVGSATPAVQTDFDGRFSIQASPGSKLEFSYIGMTTQVATVSASGTVPAISMKDGVDLTEVVVEGYRNTTRPLSNIAVTTVTAKTIEGRPNASFIQTLQGQIPGLNISTGSGQPGANSTVILRGYGSINGKVEPLFVIDGVPLDADNFRSLNPNDIESVSVLKDAGATSIYGNRGANGVIIVKTKKGSFDSPLQIKYTGITSFTQMQSNKYNTMNSRQILGLEKTAGRGFGATLTDEEINAYNINTNWKDVLFRTGTSQNHTLSLTGGGKNISSFTSFGFFEQEGILIDTKLKRFNFRNNLAGKSNNDKFSYQTSITVNYSRRDEASGLGTGSVNINPVAGSNNGLPYISPSWYVNGRQLVDMYEGDMDANPLGIGIGTLALSPLMQLDIMKTGTLQTDELKMIGNVQANYKLTDDLTVGTTFGADYTQAVGLQVQDPNSFNSLFFAQTGEDFLGWQFESFARNVLFNTNVSLNYTKTFGDHTIDASVFTEYFKGHTKSFNYAQNGLNPKLFVPGNGDGFVPFNTDTPTFYLPEVASGKGSAGLFSYFGSVDYDYKQKYGLSATIRRDASYRFAETNRWGTYWSVSGRWNIDRESFMEGSAFKMLKLRASFGTTGNQNIFGESIFNAPNNSRTLFGQGTGYGLNPAYVRGQIGNPNLMWETVEQANAGVDFEVLDSRLRGTFDVYRRTTKDLYQEAQISGVNGTYSILSNGGSMSNQGIEALLSYDVIKTNDFLLTLNFNGSYNKNKMLDITNSDNFRDLGLQADAEGGTFSQFYMIRYAGVNPASGNLLFYDKQGNLTENPTLNDRVLTGKAPIPSYQGGFGFDATYKGFFLTTQFSYVADIYRMDYDLEGLQDPSDIGQWNKSTDLLNAWTPDNRNTDIPSLFLTNKGIDGDSDRYLRDASYVRLRYMSLGYNFSPKVLDKTPFTGIRAYFQAENLVTWSKWRGWDAESNRGADQYQYPTPRILSLGLEVQF